MTVIRDTTLVGLPIEEVFDFTVDTRNEFKWNPKVRAIRPEDPARPAGRRRRRPRRRPADHAPAQGRAPRRPGRPAGPGPRHRPAAAGRPGPDRGPASPGAQGFHAGADRRGRHRALPPRHRDHRLLLHPGSPAEHRQIRGRGPGRDQRGLPRRQPPGHITDDGIGFDTTKARHGSGLQGIADRLAALGGTLDIHSQPGHGTTLSCQLPVPARDSKLNEQQPR